MLFVMSDQLARVCFVLAGAPGCFARCASLSARVVIFNLKVYVLIRPHCVSSRASIRSFATSSDFAIFLRYSCVLYLQGHL
jgi:hypothetical protein